MHTDPVSMLAFLFLYVTIVSLWIPSPWRLPLWPIPLAVSMILGWVAGHLSFAVFLPLLGLVWSTLSLRPVNRPWIRAVAAGFLIFCSVGLGAHLFPGFNNLKVIDGVRVSEDGIPFTLYLNFDKTLIGVFILGHLHTLARRRVEWLDLGKNVAARAPLIILILAVLSVVFQFVRWDPKIPEILPIWAVTNLLFVCVAEEAFFRGFLQKYLSELWQDFRFGRAAALIVASLLFGVAHFAGGWTYVVLSSLAGLGYGWMYQVTGRIEASIITHFLLNLVHILFLTYPALAT